MLSDTLAVNGLYNRAAELAMSHASIVLKQDGFLDATQVGLMGLLGVQGEGLYWRSRG